MPLADEIPAHPLIVVDKDATAELKVKTVNYFQDIDRAAQRLGMEQGIPAASAR